MTHWILRFILIAIQVQIAQQIQGGAPPPFSAANGPSGDTVKEAGAYFEPSLCKQPATDVKTDGLGWICYHPGDCAGHADSNQRLMEKMDGTDTCHALLAIQPHFSTQDSAGEHLRIVLQIQSNKVDVTKGLQFVYGGAVQIDCKLDENKVVIFKQQSASVLTYDLETSRAHYVPKDQKFMCEAKLQVTTDSNGDYKRLPGQLGIVWTDAATGETNALEKISTIWTRFPDRCQLSNIKFKQDTSMEIIDSQTVNMDRNEFTCPADYKMRIANIPGQNDHREPTFKEVQRVYCEQKKLMVVDKKGDQPFERTVQVFLHCAQKKCKQCEKPSCAASDDKMCPQLKPTPDFETCHKLTCASGTTLKFGDKAHGEEPICENKKWMLDGNEVKNAECATALDCKPTLVTVKEPDDMNMDETEVKCTKERNMTYTADDQTIVLSKLSCNKLEGKWYEVRVDPPGSELYSDENVLRCVGTDGAAAPSKGGLPLMVIGASLAAVALIIVVVIIIICCCKKRRAARESAQKHKLATKSSKSKENRSKESKSGLSKSNMASSSGAPGVSSDHSVTQKNSKKDREMKSLGIDKSEGAKTAVSIDGTNPKTAAEIKDEERSNPTERSAIPKTEDLNKDINGKKKTAAMLESSKMEDNEEPAQEAVERVQKAMGRKGATRTRNLDGTQAGTTMGPDGTQGPETMDPDGTQAMTAAQQKRRATRKGTFMQTGVADPSRGPDGTQQPSENGPDETQNPTGATAETQAATAAGRRTRGTQQTTGGRRTQGTQNGGDDDDEAEQPLWEQHTAVEKTDEGAGNTGIPRDPTRVRTTQDQTRTKMHTGVHEEESAAIDPPIDDMHTGKEKEKDDDDDSSRMNTAMAKDRKTVDKHTAVEKEDGESKKPKSKKGARQLKPREMELNEKEKKIKAGAKRNRNDYPTMRDIESDWDSDKDKKDGQPRKKKTLEEKKKKKSKQEKEKEKKDSKRKDKEKKESKKKEKEKDRKKSKTKEGEVREVTAIDDGPSGVTGQNYYTARESTARDGTQNLTPHDPTQAATAATQRTRNKTATIMTTAFDPTETHAAPTIADPTQAATAQDPTQGATTMDRTQGGGTRTTLGTTQGGHTTTMLDRTTQGGLTTVGADGTQGMTTVADFTQAHTTGADPTQAGTTIFDRTTQGQTTVGDATTQGETRTRVFTGRTRGPSRTQTQTRTRTRADFTQGGTTAADFTQGGATTIADPTQAHNTSADPTQAATTIGGDPTQAQTRVSMEESQETQHQTGTINDPTQLHSAETQEGRTKKSRTKAAFTARTGTRPGTTQSRTKADFTQGATTLADPTQAPTPTAQDPTQGVTTAGDGTQLATRTKTRTRQQGVTQTATAGDRTQTQTRKDPTQTETRGEETQQGQTEVPGTDGTQIPSKTKTRKTTGKDFTQTATAGDPTQTQTRAGGTQTQTAVDPTRTMTAVDPTHTMTAVDPTRTMTAVDRTRTETKERTGRTRTKGPTQTQTALDPTGTMTAVDRTGLTTAKDRTQTETRAGGTQTQTAVDPTRTQTAVDPTHTMTAVDPTNTMTAVDPTHMTTGKERTQTQTAVDPTHTMTAVDPTGTQTAVDRTRSATKMASRTQTQTAAEQTQTKMERTKTKTARDKTQTQTNADETQAAGATTLGAAETQAMSKPTTAKDRTQTATRDKTKEGRTQTSANKTQTTAKDQQTQMTGHETTQGPTTKDPTQTHNDQ